MAALCQQDQDGAPQFILEVRLSFGEADGIEAVVSREARGALEVSMKRPVPADADILKFSYPSFSLSLDSRRSGRTTVACMAETCGRTAFRLSGELR